MENGSRDLASIPRRFFSSPEEAVEKISDLLRREDFKTLAGYYDLSGSGISRTDLESGKFFIRRQRPEVCHPADDWRYKHPFSPGFKYWDKARASGSDEGVFVIRVGISFDQGVDSPVQRGYSLFLMIELDRGWQVLPQPADDNYPPEMPTVVG